MRLAPIRFALITVCFAIRVHAEEPGIVHLEFRLPGPGFSMSFQRDYGSHDLPTPVITCARLCFVDASHGRYRVELYDQERRSVGFTRVIADEDAIWRIDPPDPTLRDLGLAAGIAGPLMFFLGMAAAVSGFESNGCHDDCPDATERRWAKVGVLTALAGAVITPLGWVEFARNRHPLVQRTLARAAAPVLHVGVAPLPVGAAFGARFAF